MPNFFGADMKSFQVYAISYLLLLVLLIKKCSVRIIKPTLSAISQRLSKPAMFLLHSCKKEQNSAHAVALI
jgi:hypothetical protein